jgi:peptide/nickel transport system permease protein
VLGAGVLWLGTFATFCFFASEYGPLKGTPLLPAYWHWFSGVFSGRSLSQGLYGPLWPRVLPALGHTTALLGFTMVLVVTGATAFGCLTAARRGSAVDTGLRGASYLAWALPPFILALVLAQFFGGKYGNSGLPWFPPGGWAGECPGGLGIDLHTFKCAPAGTGLTYIRHVLWYLTLPAVALATGFVGLHGRYLRSGLVQALDAPHITTARAKGVSETRILLRHALRNSLIAFVPALLSDFGAIFGASLAVDLLFSLNGIGTMFVRVLNTNSSVNVLDTNAAQLLLLLGGVLVLAASVLGELALTFLDPRVELR